ncbi:MAG: outer membrane beta-barrel domain-containing protein, partial [Proteobacteria bacterium]
QQSPAVTEKPATTEKKEEIKDIKDVSDLGKLSTFNDVAVIQRRYLPKTGRFEIFAAPSLVLNDAFFMNFGLNGRLGYNFSERYGVEVTGFALTTSQRDVTKDLASKRGVLTTSLITPKSYIGLDLKYTPIYGKMTSSGASITPFDLYFSVGAGMTATNQGGSEPTLHIGTGQIFALSKSMALRWDFSWNMFTAESSVETSRGRAFYNTILISTGVSFFFPEAKYR